MHERENPRRLSDFDLRETLAKIMGVFWAKGFGGTFAERLGGGHEPQERKSIRGVR